MIAWRVAALAVVTMSVCALRRSVAQDTLRAGQVVRVRTAADNSLHQGRVRFFTADTLVLEDGQRREWVGLGSGDRLEVMARSRSLAWAGALVGGGIGAALGSTSRRRLCQGMSGPISFDLRYCGMTSAVGAAVYGTAGLIVGALIGSRIRTTVWVPLPREQLGRVQLTFAPLLGGGGALGAVVSLR